MTDYNEYRVGGFRILPIVTKNLLIVNALFFLATFALRQYDLTDLLGLHFITASKFHFFQAITYMFMHGSFSHLFFNMFALWMFGAAIENYWGVKRFLIYYFVTGIGAAVIQELTWAIELQELLSSSAELVNTGSQFLSKSDYLNLPVTVGASGAVYGLLLAFGMMFPNAMIYIYFFIPMKAKWFVIIYGVIELASGVMGSSDGIAHFAHLGGMIFGFLLILYWRHTNKRKQNRYRQQYDYQNQS
jgi:membrane associated rhomboid family serine protease